MLPFNKQKSGIHGDVGRHGYLLHAEESAASELSGETVEEALIMEVV